MISAFLPTLPVDSVPEGTMHGVAIGSDNILIACVGGELFAINDICTHFHANLSSGELLVDSCQVQCPLHDSCFDLRSGEPSDPPAEDPVETYAVKVIDGIIHVGPKHDA